MRDMHWRQEDHLQCSQQFHFHLNAVSATYLVASSRILLIGNRALPIHLRRQGGIVITSVLSIFIKEDGNGVEMGRGQSQYWKKRSDHLHSHDITFPYGNISARYKIHLFPQILAQFNELRRLFTDIIWILLQTVVTDLSRGL